MMITGNSSSGSWSSVDNGFLMSILKRWSMSDELSSLLPWANCWWRDGHQWARSQAMTRQSAPIVIAVDCVQSNRNHITCRFWSCSRLVMLAANANFPTPGDPFIKITLWLLVLLISVSICCGMSRRVPFIHGSQRGSLFSLRACTKSSRSCITQISIMRSTTSWSLNPSTFFCNSITLSFWETVRMYLAGSTTQLKSHPIQIYMHQTSSWASCEWSPSLLPSSQEICW